MEAVALTCPRHAGVHTQQQACVRSVRDFGCSLSMASFLCSSLSAVSPRQVKRLGASRLIALCDDNRTGTVRTSLLRG